MLKKRKFKRREIALEKDEIDLVNEEAETIRFIDRLELQRKLLKNFIEPKQKRTDTQNSPIMGKGESKK